MADPAPTPSRLPRCFLPLVLLLLAGRLPAQSSPSQASPTPTEIAKDLERVRNTASDLAERQLRESELLDRDLKTRWAEDSRRNLPDLVFLPPLPPALFQSAPDPAALEYPALLADYAGESFFMAYGSLRFRQLLQPRHEEHVARYVAERERLTFDLRAQLAASRSLPPAERRAALAAFAPSQSPALHALETTAESIRAELAPLGGGDALLRRSEEINPAQNPGLLEYLKAVHAAQFQEGLSLEQRHLLQAVASSLQLGLDPNQPGETGYFLPALARISRPDPADATSTEQRQRFDDLRRSLETELRQAVLGPSATVKNARQASALAARQAARFDELHQLAEEIRLGLADRPDPAEPAPSRFPPDLVRQVGEAVAGKSAFQTECTRRVQALNRSLAPRRVKLVMRGPQPILEFVPPTAAGDEPDALRSANEELLGLHRTLTEAMQAARDAVVRYSENHAGENLPAVGKLSAQLARLHAQQETWRRFSDYRAAVLEPGLSPAQRRLLFNAALRDLEKARLQAAD
ncbi:hypothetical protein ESB00_02810 [Oleiharenicola lentus]|uniref:TolC family protein n=1 Tax=Oleiharenicola lentus TaxID=2508720 RepID=A0A4Q1C7E3_9BACT|nr:hypothetical protein [Oleiharenicola lentus]RXK54845.1 hypothetical protein ESB00_02810 [Oleiharenicola lentus]